MSSARGLGALGAGTVAAAVLGLALQSMIGFFFGAGAETDAYFMSLYIVAFLAKAFMFGPLKSIALPEYAGLGVRSRDGTLLLARVRRQAGAAALLAATAALVFAPWLVDAFAPGYDGEQRALTVALLRIRSPALAFLALTTTSLVALEASNRFGRVALGNKVLPAAATVLLVVVLGDRFGVTGLGWAGMAGTAAGGLALLVWTRRESPRPSSPPAGTAVHRQAARRVWRRWAGLGWSNAAATGGEWVYRVAASTLGPGLFTAVVFGRMVHDLLHGALNDSSSTMALARFSRAPDRNPGTALASALESLSAAAVPVAVFVAVMSPWIAALLFGRGELARDGMLGPVSASMALFMAGVVVQGRNQLAFQAAFATDRSALVNRVQVVGHVFRALALVPATWLWSFAGLVAAQVAMNAVVAGAFWLSAPPELAPGRRVAAAFHGVGRIAAATTGPAILLLLVVAVLPEPSQASELLRLGVVSAAGLSWCVLVLAAGRLCRVPLYDRLARRLQNRLAGRRT